MIDDRKMRIWIIIILFFSFVFSVFLIVAERNDMWEKWFTEEDEFQALNVLREDSLWSYMDVGEEPGVGNVWTTFKYEAHTWKKMQGIFQKDISEDNIFGTAFFRYEFDLQDLDEYLHIEGNIRYSDAVIIYLNGSIIYAGNVPSSGYRSNIDMGASNIVDTIEEKVFYITDLSPLRKGKNILAVEVHRKDLTSRDIFFHFPYLKLFKTEKEEYIPDTKGIILLQEEEMDEIEVNWLTDSQGSYKVEYMEKNKEKVYKSTFSEYANSVIMGSKRLEDGEAYINTGILTRLKSGTDYLYRVIEFGSKKGSQIYEFRTAEKKEISFVYPGTIQNNDTDIKLWHRKLQKGLDLCGGTDILILGKEKVINNEIGFRAAIGLKEIPAIITEPNQMKNQYWTYSDMILINIDLNNKTFEENKKFIEELIKEKNRKWSIIIMNESIFKESGQIKTEYEELFRKLDVDLVLDRGRSYSRYNISEEGLERGDVLKKAKGESVYITGGIFVGNIEFNPFTVYREHIKFQEDQPCIIKIKPTRREIIIETYRIDDGEKVDFFRVIKDD